MPAPSARLHIVTGKGGVGKSTLAAALALCAQARGERVLVCEVSAQERVSGLLGAPDSGTEIRAVDRLIHTVHVRPPEAMREYALMVLRFKAIYTAVFENRLVRYFLRAVPSLAEIVILGKVWWHVVEERDASGRLRWDRVILDAPATGHGLALLRTPRSILELVSDGPMVRDMKRMQEMLVDGTSQVSIAALPEEMPANEAIELYESLKNDLKLPLGSLFLNAFHEERFTAGEREAISLTDAPGLEPARRATRFYGQRQDLSTHYAQKLAEAVALPLVKLPYVPGDDFGRAQVERLAQVLGRDA